MNLCWEVSWVPPCATKGRNLDMLPAVLPSRFLLYRLVGPSTHRFVPVP